MPSYIINQMRDPHVINVIGGGLAGVEAAWQAAELGAKVRLYEMRPVQQTPAHRTDKLAEIVCSNSLKTDEPGLGTISVKRRAASRRVAGDGGRGGDKSSGRGGIIG